MGWKASLIIINKPGEVNNEKLLQDLGFSGLTPIPDEPVEVAINPDSKKVYIGTYLDNLIIFEADIPMHFFDTATDTEKTLVKHFPNSEICSLVLHSGVNLWGYAIIQNGNKIRCRAGSSEDGTFADIGIPLPEEQELLNKSTVSDTGERTYVLPEIDSEPMTEDQVGENFVFAVSKRYLGEELDRADDFLFETTLNGYAYSKVNSSSKTSSTSGAKADKAWWKFW